MRFGVPSEVNKVGANGNGNGNGSNGQDGSNDDDNGNASSYKEMEVCEAENIYKEKYRKRKEESGMPLGYFAQWKYLIKRYAALKIIAGIWLVLGIFGIITLAFLWWVLTIPGALAWLSLTGLVITTVYLRSPTIPTRYKGIGMVAGVRIPELVLNEGLTIFNFRNLLGYEKVRVVPLDVKLLIKNVKTAGGGYCEEIWISFKLSFIDVAINEFLNAGGKHEDGKGAGGIVDLIDGNIESALRRASEKMPLDEVQSISNKMLKRIIADVLNGLFSHPMEGRGPKRPYREGDIDPFAAIYLYFMGIIISNMRIENVQADKRIVEKQIKVVTEGYERIYEKQDTNTRIYQMLVIIRAMKKLQVNVNPLSILNMVWESENINKGVKTLPGLQELFSSLANRISPGAEPSFDVAQIMQEFLDMDEEEMIQAMRSMEGVLERAGYASKKPNEKGNGKGGKK